MVLDQTRRLQYNYKTLKNMERAIEIANTVYLTFISKNDTDDAVIYFTSSRGRDWRSMSYGHRFTGFMPSSLCGCHRGHRQPPHCHYVLDLLGDHIPIWVNIERAQTLLNTQVMHVTVEGHNHTRAANVRPIVNMYYLLLLLLLLLLLS